MALKHIHQAFMDQNFADLANQLNLDHKLRTVVARYIRSNQRDVNHILKFLQLAPWMKDHCPSWLVFRAYEEGCLTKDMICDGEIANNGKILLNWPEMKEKLPLLGQFYPETQKIEENEIIAKRTKPYFGDICATAIVHDSVSDLAKCLAEPNFDIDARIGGWKPLEIAIEWGSIACFHFLLLNGASRQYAMEEAVRFGRVEMIEVLEQDGQSFDGCIEAAFRGHQTAILQWLLETNRYGNLTKILGDHLNFGFNPNKEGIGIVLSHIYSIKPDGCFDVDSLLGRWVRENAGYLSKDVVTAFAPVDFVRPRVSTLGPYFLRYLLCRHPFDADLVNSARSSFEMQYSIGLSWGDSPDAVRYCLNHFDRSKLRLCIAAETLVGLADSIDLDSIDWWGSPRSMKDVIAIQNAGASLTRLNESGQTILHRLAANASPSFGAIAYVLSQGVDPNIKCHDGKRAIDLTTDPRLRSVLQYYQVSASSVASETIDLA